jgi:hypothetical protein
VRALLTLRGGRGGRLHLRRMVAAVMRCQPVGADEHGGALAARKVVRLRHVRAHRRQGGRHRHAPRALDLGHGRSLGAPPARSRNKTLSHLLLDHLCGRGVVREQAWWLAQKGKPDCKHTHVRINI